MRNALQTWLVLFLLTVTVSCEHATSPATSQPTPQVRLAEAANSSPLVAKQDTSHVVAEAVVARLFQALAYSKMQPVLRTYQKKFTLTTASQDSAAPDSAITYVAAPNSFVYLKSSSATAPGAVLLRCQLSTTPARLTKIIYLGMSKAALEHLLGQPFSATVLLISETEGYQKFYFTFQKGVLQTIAFESDYLD